MNCLSIIGNVGYDAETRFTPSNKVVTNFSVAMNSGWGDNKKTTWVNCSLWGDRGQKVAPYIIKGSKIGVVGEISLREWESNGRSGVSLECKVIDITLLGDANADSGAAPASQATPAPAPAPQQQDALDDDIPF